MGKKLNSQLVPKGLQYKCSINNILFCVAEPDNKSYIYLYLIYVICLLPPHLGPDNVRDHRVKTINNMQYVGEGVRSSENTSAIHYLFRAPKSAAFPLAKNGRIGEIGWEAEHLKDGKIVY